MLKRISIILVRTYKIFFSRIFGHSCRFYPSCSCYALEAFESNNFLKAWAKIIWRILRCNPFSAGGYEPVKK